MVGGREERRKRGAREGEREGDTDREHNIFKYDPLGYLEDCT